MLRFGSEAPDNAVTGVTKGVLHDTTIDRAARERRFVEALPIINDTLRFIGRRHRLTPQDVEDFSSEVKLSFIQKDYEVLARFQGRSSLKTYLVTVIQRLFLDRQRRQWGKWRPSAQARRLGPVAMLLERLVYRDGIGATEACELLRTNHGTAESEAELKRLLMRLPVRAFRRGEPPASDPEGAPGPASGLASAQPGPLATLLSSEVAARCQSAIEASVEALDPEDRVLLRLRFEDDVSVADISRSLSLDQNRLYRRIESMLASFRERMESSGLGWAEVAGLIERGECHLRLPPENFAEKSAARPSPLEATS